MNVPAAIELPSAWLARVDALLRARPRVLLGLAGPPGAGKSTIAQALHQHFAHESVVVPMDGFHFANSELRRLGRASRKGAPDTFDAAGYVALLQRIRRQQDGEVVYAPEFRREIEEAVAGAIAVGPAARLIITEGNYLLLDESPWTEAAAQLDEVWYVDIDPALRVSRLVDRHVHFGRSRDAAQAWVQSNDELNAQRVEAARARASFVVRW